jgi:hypothetical protein
MKIPLLPILSLSLGLSSVFGGTASYTFDTDLGDFTAGSDAGALPPVWSDFNGGSMMLEFNGGWAPRKATIDLVASTRFDSTFREALTNGGTVSFDLIVRTNDILPGSTVAPNVFPGWFEPMLVGNSQGVEDRPFGGNDGVTAYYGAGQFPVGAERKTTISVPIEAASSTVDDDGRLQFNPASSTFTISFGLNTEAAKATSSKYFIDNFRITSNTVAVVVPPPKTGLEPAVAGWNIYSSGTGQYDRQTLRTTTPQYSWIGQATPANPVTYSLTISDYPGKPGMGTLFYLVPGTGLGVGMNYPDYGEPRVIAGYLNNNANGTGTLRLAYKNDVANSNGTDPSSLYGNGSPDTLWPDNPAWVAGDPRAPGTGMGGTLATVNGASIIGKWSIAFTSNTSVTITSPSGETASGALPNEATAQLFADPMYAYFGTVPGEPSRIGERVIFSGISITGGTNQITGDIDSNMTSGLLEKSATVPDGIRLIDPAVTPFWFTWTLPATDFVLQQSVNLGNVEAWSDLPLTGNLNQPGGKRVLLEAANLNSVQRNFLRMFKQAPIGP